MNWLLAEISHSYIQEFLELNGTIQALLGTSLIGGVAYIIRALRKLYKEQKDQTYLIVETDKRLKKTDKRLKEIEEASELRKKGLVALQHDRIYTECDRIREKGTISVEEMQNLEKLYNTYAANGGNGTAKKLYEEVIELPKE